MKRLSNLKSIKIRHISIQQICIGGFLTVLASLFQGAPVLLPVVGLVLSPLSTLPVALSASMSPYLGSLVYISSTLILFLIYAQEALIFLCATGLLGLIIGISITSNHTIKVILLASIGLTLGIVCLSYVVEIPGLVSIIENFSFFLIIIGVYSFSLVYSFLWTFIITYFVHAFHKKLTLYSHSK